MGQKTRAKYPSRQNYSQSVQRTNSNESLTDDDEEQIKNNFPISL